MAWWSLPPRLRRQITALIPITAIARADRTKRCRESDHAKLCQSAVTSGVDRVLAMEPAFLPRSRASSIFPVITSTDHRAGGIIIRRDLGEVVVRLP